MSSASFSIADAFHGYTPQVLELCTACVFNKLLFVLENPKRSNIHYIAKITFEDCEPGTDDCEHFTVDTQEDDDDPMVDMDLLDDCPLTENSYHSDDDIHEISKGFAKMCQTMPSDAKLCQTLSQDKTSKNSVKTTVSKKIPIKGSKKPVSDSDSDDNDSEEPVKKVKKQTPNKKK